MQFDFVYADLKLEVLFDADTGSPFCELTDNEIEMLNKLVYISLTNFNWLRAIILKNKAEIKARMDGARKRDNEYRGEQ